MKTLESIREEIWEEMLRLEDKRKDQWADIKYQTLREVLQKLGHLDEPEVLSEEWLDENKSSWTKLKIDGYYIPVEKLQNLLMPKQEEIKVSKMWHDVIAQNKEEGHSLRWTLNYIDNLNVNDVDDFAKAWLAYPNIEIEEEPKYYVLDKENATLLKKSAVGEEIAKSVGTNIYNAKSWKNEEEYQLTEQEIKDYDERYWPFAVKVEELKE